MMSSSSSAVETNVDDAAANAPEPDPDNLAPEYRGEHVDLEVPPVSGMHTFYDGSPPEAITTSFTTNTERVDGSDTKSRLVSRRTAILLAIAVAILALANLGIGLGVGLTRHTKEPDDSSKSSPPSSNPSITSTSLDVQPSQVPAVPPSKHAVLNDTSIAAVTMPNGDRRVFFQERSGNIRQAKYSISAQEWAAESTTNFVLDIGARNNTPLAAISYSDSDGDSFVLYYVSATESALAYVHQYSQGGPNNTFIGVSMAANVSMASQSRHLSATTDGQNTLISYEDSSNVFNVVYGARGNTDREWHNVTSDVLSSVIEVRGTDGDTDLQLTDTCSFSLLMLYCFTAYGQRSRPNLAPVQAKISATNASDISFETNFIDPTGSFPNVSQSDLVGLSTNSMSMLWFNQTQLQSWVTDLPEDPDQPLPHAQFPFRRLGRAQEFNGTGAYIYHQMNDSIIAEEFWNGSEEFWLESKNISIST